MDDHDATPPAPKTPPARTWAIALAIAVALGGGLFAARSGYVARAPGGPSGSTSMPVTDLALIAPLRPGATLDGFTLAAIDPVADGVMTIHLRRGDTRVRLMLALAATDSPPAPVSVGRYAIFYSATKEDGATADGLAKQLAEVVGKNENAAAPLGLGPFRPVTPSL